MNSRSLRRLAADHGALHNQELPPNYLFPAATEHSDDLTQLDILIAGPTHTPFERGVWKLHLSIPPTYPQQPPTANFRTPIFHPNVEPQTGGVCVETLKRDWDSKLTLRDVLITISCLLIQPNPDSALNADAGQLIQEDYANFAQRAQLMTSIHAVVPLALQAAVREAQTRGQEIQDQESDQHVKQKVESVPEAPARRRRTIARVRGRMAGRRSDSPLEMPARRRPQPQPSHDPFVFHARNDDVFGEVMTPPRRTEAAHSTDEDDESMDGGDQENDVTRSPEKPSTPPAQTPRRPHGAPVPLGELIMDQDDYDTSQDVEMDTEYPPSPRKSGSKMTANRRQRRVEGPRSNIERPESSHQALMRAPNLTPAGFNNHQTASPAPNKTPPNHNNQPLIDDSLFMDVTMEPSPSPRKLRRELFATPAKRNGKALFNDLITPDPKVAQSIAKPRLPTSAELHAAELERIAQRQAERRENREWHAKMWKLCGGDIKRWNRGDFDGNPFNMVAPRW